MENKSIESRVIDLLRLPLCICVVFYHTYSATQTVPWLNEGKPIYQNICYIFSLEFGEIVVPLFFLMSGYLFFHTTELSFKVYKKKINSRIKSLLFPYLFWNFLFITFFYIAEQLPNVSQYFSGVNKPVSNYTWLDFLRAFWDRGSWQNGNSTPFDWPLWYIRNLMCLILLSPVVKYFVLYGRLWGIGILAIFWMTSNTVAYTVTSCLFFSLGAYLSLIKKQFIFSKVRIRYYLLGLYPCLLLVDFFTRGIVNHIVIHRLTVLSGIFFAIYFVTYWVDSYDMKGKNYWGALAFFIYAVHNPILNLVRKLTIKLFPLASDLFSVLLYFVDAILVIGFIVLVFILLKKYLPRFLMFSVGGRG